MAWLDIVSLGYPALLVGSFYGLWLVAALVLGHPPRPMLDDPKSISLVVDVPCYIPSELLVGSPVAVLGGIARHVSATRGGGVLRSSRLRVLHAC